MGLGLSSKLKTASCAQGQWNTGAANPSRFRRSSRRGLYVQRWGGSCGSCGGATHPCRFSLGDLVQLLGLASAMVISAVGALPFFGADFAGQEGPGRCCRGRHRKIGSRQASSQKKSPVKGRALTWRDFGSLSLFRHQKSAVSTSHAVKETSGHAPEQPRRPLLQLSYRGERYPVCIPRSPHHRTAGCAFLLHPPTGRCPIRR
jgi:hypothetical protein